MPASYTCRSDKVREWRSKVQQLILQQQMVASAQLQPDTAVNRFAAATDGCCQQGQSTHSFFDISAPDRRRVRANLALIPPLSTLSLSLVLLNTPLPRSLP